jgi:predicted transposase YbfD/YdcC
LPTTSRLVLGQKAVDEKSNEITAIPALLERIDLEGALVSVDAMGCNPDIAQSILDAEVDYLLAVKDNQPTLHPRSKAISTQHLLAKSIGTKPSARITASSTCEPTGSPTSSTGPPPSTPIRARPVSPNSTPVAVVESRIERGDKIETERRSYISSRAISAEAFADAVRNHWAIEKNLHWTLDVTFNEDQSRLRAGHGAKNMAVVRHFALNLVRQAADKRSIKTRRKRASWDPQYLLQTLGPLRRKLGLVGLVIGSRRSGHLKPRAARRLSASHTGREQVAPTQT